MDVPNLQPIGSTGFYPPQDRAVLAGRGFVVSAEFGSVPGGATRYVGLKIDSDHVGIVWSVSAGNVAGGFGNNPGTLQSFAGEISSPAPVTPINLMTTGPAAEGFTAESGSALEGGAVPGDKQSFNLSGQNILNGIRVFGPGTSAVLGITNEDGSAGDLTVSILIAVFDKTEVDDVVL